MLKMIKLLLLCSGSVRVSDKARVMGLSVLVGWLYFAFGLQSAWHVVILKSILNLHMVILESISVYVGSLRYCQLVVMLCMMNFMLFKHKCY
jgi:hypothetical protein